MGISTLISAKISFTWGKQQSREWTVIGTDQHSWATAEHRHLKISQSRQGCCNLESFKGSYSYCYCLSLRKGGQKSPVQQLIKLDCFNNFVLSPTVKTKVTSCFSSKKGLMIEPCSPLNFLLVNESYREIPPCRGMLYQHPRQQKGSDRCCTASCYH